MTAENKEMKIEKETSGRMRGIGDRGRKPSLQGWGGIERGVGLSTMLFVPDGLSRCPNHIVLLPTNHSQRLLEILE